MVKFVFENVKGKKKILIFIVTANFLTFALSLLLPCCNGFYFDMLINSYPRKSILQFGIFIAVLGIATIILTYLFNIYKAQIQTKFVFKMCNDVIGAIQRADYSQSGKYNSTYLHQRLNVDTGKVWSFFFDNIINSFFNILSIVVVIIAISQLNIKLFLLIMLVTPIYIISYFLLKRPLYEKSKEFKDNQSNFYKQMDDQFIFLKLIKLWSNYQENEDKRNHYFHEYLKGYMDYTKLLYLYNSLESFISIIFKVTALIVGGFEIMAGRLTVGTFTVIASYFGIMIKNIKFFFSFGQAYQDAKNSYEWIAHLLKLEKEEFGTLCITEKIHQIMVSNLSFGYNTESLFRNYHVTFKRGLNLLIGANGKGKSTLILLLCGLYREKGNKCIFFNNIEISQIDIEAFRKNKVSIYIQNQIGMDEKVLQMLTDFTGSNYCEIERKIHENQLEDLYLSNEFDITAYLQRPMNELSGGETQRLYLLPVLIKDTELLILDEPTTDLDSHAKAVLCEFLLKKSETCIVILITHEDYLFEGRENVNIIRLG